ncbi:MAG: ATP-binding protein [Gammaproteobacteria bacterium]
MSSPTLSPTRDLINGVARPLIIVFGTLLAALVMAAIISGLIVRELRVPLDYGTRSALTVAAKLRDMREAADGLDLLITNTQLNTFTDANVFVREAQKGRNAIDQALIGLPPVARSGLYFDVLDEQREQLFSSLDEIGNLEAQVWAKQKRTAALGQSILSATEQAITMTRDHNARFGKGASSMTRALSEVRYYLSSMNAQTSAVVSDADRGTIDNAANLYAVNLRRAVGTLSRLPDYPERAALFEYAQSLFDLGHDDDGFYSSARQLEDAQASFAVARDHYRQISDEFRGSIKGLAAANDQDTAATLRSAQTGLARYQTLLLTAVLLTLLIGLIVIKRYVFDAVVVRLRALRNATLAMAGGELDTHVDTRGNDEISDLAQALGSFRKVADDRARSEQALKERTVQLELANTELDEFAYIASHDLRAPLHGIDSLASFVQEDMEGKLPIESARHISLMRARIKRLHSLLDSLLEFSRVGRENVEPEWTSLSEMIAASASLFESPMFTLALNIENTEVQVARAPFDHVIRNLIDNAIKHHDQNTGSILISAEVKDSAVHLDVTDDGPGIPAKFHERIFGMFQTLQARDKIEGSGMGLAYLKKSTTHYGGRISVRSDPDVARGATFHIEWPITGQRDAS